MPITNIFIRVLSVLLGLITTLLIVNKNGHNSGLYLNAIAVYFSFISIMDISISSIGHHFNKKKLPKKTIVGLFFVMKLLIGVIAVFFGNYFKKSEYIFILIAGILAGAWTKLLDNNLEIIAGNILLQRILFLFFFLMLGDLKELVFALAASTIMSSLIIGGSDFLKKICQGIKSLLNDLNNIKNPIILFHFCWLYILKVSPFIIFSIISYIWYSQLKNIIPKEYLSISMLTDRVLSTLISVLIAEISIMILKDKYTSRYSFFKILTLIFLILLSAPAIKIIFYGNEITYINLTSIYYQSAIAYVWFLFQINLIIYLSYFIKLKFSYLEVIRKMFVISVILIIWHFLASFFDFDYIYNVILGILFLIYSYFIFHLKRDLSFKL